MALLEGQVIQVIDANTGEVLTETRNPNAGVYLGRKKKHPGGFVIVYESEFRDITLMLAPKGALTLALFNILMTKVEIGTGEIIVNTVEIAEMMDVYQQQISKSVKNLSEMGAICFVRKEGKHSVYRMNPSVMWKGKETERQDLLKVIDGGKKGKSKGLKNV